MHCATVNPASVSAHGHLGGRPTRPYMRHLHLCLAGHPASQGWQRAISWAFDPYGGQFHDGWLERSWHGTRYRRQPGSEVQYLNADPDAAEWESDTDVPLPVTMAALASDLAIKEISMLLQEIPLAQLPSSMTSKQGASPEHWMLLDLETDRAAGTCVPASPVEASFPG